MHSSYRKPVSQLTLCDRNEIVELLKCHLFKITIPEISQFSEGLESLGVLKYVKQYSDIMRELFVNETSSLPAGIFYHLNIV